MTSAPQPREKAREKAWCFCACWYRCSGPLAPGSSPGAGIRCRQESFFGSLEVLPWREGPLSQLERQMVSSQHCPCHSSCLVEEALLNVESDADVREMRRGLSFICYVHPLESRVHRCEMKKALSGQTSLKRFLDSRTCQNL